MNQNIEFLMTKLFESLAIHDDVALGLGPWRKCQGVCGMKADALDRAFQGAMLASEKREDVSA